MEENPLPEAFGIDLGFVMYPEGSGFQRKSFKGAILEVARKSFAWIHSQQVHVAI